jgi:hypothetical protein
MIRETELNLFVPSPELLVKLASGDRPLGVRAGPPRVKSIRETFFDTRDQTLRRRGMTCKLRQVEGEGPSVVVTVGEGPDSEGITSRSRLTADSVGAGVFETLKGDSAAAGQIQKFVDPGQLRPQIALDIQRLGRVFRGGLFLKPVLLLFFDRIQVQAGGATSVFHEISIRRRRTGGPLIRDLARRLRDEHHLFPDGLNRLQRAYRMLAVEGKKTDKGLSPYGLNLALALFKEGSLGLLRRQERLHIPTFRGSGEDAARALSADLTGTEDLPLLRLGTTEPREGRAVAELWTIPDAEPSGEAVEPSRPSPLVWVPWWAVLEQVGGPVLRDPTLISALLLLTRKRLLGQLPWLGEETAPRDRTSDDALLGTPQDGKSGPAGETDSPPENETEGPSGSVPSLEPELERTRAILPLLHSVEDPDETLRNRLEALTRIHRELTWIFLQDVTRAKGRILSADAAGEEESLVALVDLISIRVRGIVGRVYRCFQEEILPQLEAAQIYVRPWEGLMNADRATLLEAFEANHLPSMEVASEWGPSFIPDMPMAGTAVGVLARLPNVDEIRFFHAVLGPEAPAFLAVPGSTTVVPLEEVIRGYFMAQDRELERAETHTFRFTTGASVVREREAEPVSRFQGEDRAEDEESDGAAEREDREAEVGAERAPDVEEGEEEANEEGLHEDSRPQPRLLETRQSVVVQVLIHRRMPESYQAQLLRALERQVNRTNPLIGWSDLYPVTGPLDLSSLERFLDPDTGDF